MKINKIYRNIILIRFHHVTLLQLKRFEMWNNHSLIYYKYIYLTDTNCFKYVNLKDIYCITAEKVMKNYPSIKNSGLCKNRSLKFYLLTFHIEHLILCMKLLMRKYKFKYIWILEQDIGYTGNINYFFRKYDKIRADLISEHYSIENSGWYYCCTNEYMSNVKKKFNYSGYKTYEHIQRWSVKYIKSIIPLLKRDFHSQSEVASIEFLLFLNLSFHRIDNEDIGYKYSWNSTVKKDEWDRIKQIKTNGNKLFHSLKF